MASGIFAEADLTAENGHVAEFRYPINDCSRRNLRVQVLHKYGYSNQWTWLPDYANSGTSDGDLSPSVPPEPAAIDAADIAAFAATFAKCHGDTGYNPCADYQPNDCVDLQDVPRFATIYYWDQNKAMPRTSPGASAHLRYQSDSVLDLVVQSDTPWAAAASRLRSTALEEAKVAWVAGREFADRAIMIVPEAASPGDCVLIVLAPGGAGATLVGSLVADGGRFEPVVEIVSVDLAKFDPVAKLWSGSVPKVAALADPQPNPFNPSTTIAFDLPTSEVVTVSVFDLGGRLVRRLVDRQLLAAGAHSTSWDGRDEAGLRVAGGVYLYVLDSPTIRLSKRMTLLK